MWTMQWINWCVLGEGAMPWMNWCMLGDLEHAKNQLYEIFAVMNWSVLEHAEAVTAWSMLGYVEVVMDCCMLGYVEVVMDCCMLGYVEAVVDCCMQGDVEVATGCVVWSLRWPCEHLCALHKTPGGTSRHYPKSHVVSTCGPWIHEVSPYSPTKWRS